MNSDRDSLTELFLENPERHYQDALNWTRSAKKYVRDEAEGIESGLENKVTDKNWISDYKVITSDNKRGKGLRNFIERDEGPSKTEVVSVIAASLIVSDGGENVLKKLKQEKGFFSRNIPTHREDQKLVTLLYYKIRREEGWGSSDFFEGRGTEDAVYRHSDREIVFKSKLPESILNKNLPEILRPLENTGMGTSESKFRSVLAHELNHAWLHYRFNSNNRVLSRLQDTFLNMDGRRAHYETIDEIFANYVGQAYADVSGPSTAKGRYQNYQDPDKINWGLKIIQQKAEELQKRGEQRHPIDLSRKFMAQIVQNMSKNSSTEAYRTFLKACLYKSDKRKFQVLRNNFSKQEIEFVKKFARKHRNEIENPNIKNDIEALMNVSWKDGRELEERILNEAVNSSSSKNFKDLNWINSKMSSLAEEKIRELETILRVIEELKSVMNAQDRKLISQREQEIQEAVKKLKSVDK